MNPFTESTVARPLAERPCPRFSSAAIVARARTRRSLARLALGVLAGVSLPGVAAAVDVNAASSEQLRDVRGIGPKTAQIIVEERSRGGPYESITDLSDRVKGIGPKKAAALQASGLRVGAGGTGNPVFASTPGRAPDAATASASAVGKPATSPRRGLTPQARTTRK